MAMLTACAAPVRSVPQIRFNSEGCAEGALRRGVGYSGAGRAFAHACALDDPGACSLLGVLQETGASADELPVQRSPSWRLFHRSCRHGYPEACANLAKLYHAQPAGAERAAKLYDFACQRGVAAACETLATMYRQGDGVASDEARAVALNYTACVLGHGPGCMRLGRDEENRGRVPSAARWYREGCRQGDMAGCRALDRLFSERRHETAARDR
jgi:TPR repeat protein